MNSEHTRCLVYKFAIVIISVAIMSTLGCAKSFKEMSSFFKSSKSKSASVEQLEKELQATLIGNKPPMAIAESGWGTSFEQAMRESARTGKPVLAEFTGSDWCHYCVKLKENVLETPEFKEWARDKVILLELDFPKRKPMPADLRRQNERLATRYEVKGYPTVLMLDSRGEVLGKLRYMDNVNDWLESASVYVPSDEVTLAKSNDESMLR